LVRIESKACKEYLCNARYLPVAIRLAHGINFANEEEVADELNAEVNDCRE
jgi:hypothetical protein